MHRNGIRISWLMTILLCVGAAASAEDVVDVDVGVDLYSRYVWRGAEVGSTPSVQPTVAFASHGFELGSWAAYALSQEDAGSEEIDLWMGYTRELSNGVGLGVILTDYHYPNAGMRFSDSKAHTLEAGVSVTGPESFPMTVSGYVNVHNDDGNNTYFQLDYPATAGVVELDFFVGASGGSAENPEYYGTDSFNVINMGLSATRAVDVSPSLALPLMGWLIYNPRSETAFVVVGLEL